MISDLDKSKAIEHIKIVLKEFDCNFKESLGGCKESTNEYFEDHKEEEVKPDDQKAKKRKC